MLTIHDLDLLDNCPKMLASFEQFMLDKLVNERRLVDNSATDSAHVVAHRMHALGMILAYRGQHC